MIRSIDLLNYQSHIESHIDLCDGFNAITGVSDAGKSVIIRAADWVRLNRPLGDEIVNWDAKKEDTTTVKIVTDKCSVQKNRTNGKSSYLLSTGRGKPAPFDVVKTDVPEEIEQALDMTDINVQGQHDKYLFLNDTAGEVARKLNELVGLDIIDTIYKNLNSRITEAKRNISSKKEEIELKESQIKSFSYLEDVVF